MDGGPSLGLVCILRLWDYLKKSRKSQTLLGGTIGSLSLACRMGGLGRNASHTLLG